MGSSRCALSSGPKGRAGHFISIGLCAGLASCADDSSYPSVAKIADVGTVLTPEERQKVLDNLQKQNRARVGLAEASAPQAEGGVGGRGLAVRRL